MAAAEGPSGTPRLARARAAVVRLRDAVPAVPAGLAGLTDRVLPYLFPTLDEQAFAATLARSVLIESPPPQQVSTNATSFDALASLARDGFFKRSAGRRTCVLVTDGETRQYSPAAWSARSQGRAVAVCWSCASESPPSGSSAPTARPKRPTPPTPQRPTRRARSPKPPGARRSPRTTSPLRRQPCERAADVGPVGRQRTGASELALAPYAAALALAAVLALVGLRLRRVRLHRILTEA